MNVYIWSGNIRDGSSGNNASAVIAADSPDEFDDLIATYWHMKVLKDREAHLRHWENPDPAASEETKASFRATANHYASLETYWRAVHGPEEVARWRQLIRETPPTDVTTAYTVPKAQVITLVVGGAH